MRWGGVQPPPPPGESVDVIILPTLRAGWVQGVAVAVRWERFLCLQVEANRIPCAPRAEHMRAHDGARHEIWSCYTTGTQQEAVAKGLSRPTRWDVQTRRIRAVRPQTRSAFLQSLQPRRTLRFHSALTCARSRRHAGRHRFSLRPHQCLRALAYTAETRGPLVCAKARHAASHFWSPQNPPATMPQWRIMLQVV